MNRGLLSSDTYVVGNLSNLELAQADLIYTLVSAPDITEGGYKISLADKKSLIELANGLYDKYGQTPPLQKTAKFVQRW